MKVSQADGQISIPHYIAFFSIIFPLAFSMNILLLQ